MPYILADATKKQIMKYLVTTKPIASDQPIIMVDGTVHGWTFKPGDRHFDHHKSGGAKVQIDEIPASVASSLQGSEIFVTTQVDADACVAAAWCQVGDRITEEQKRKLRAIAWDCDHLSVPDELTEPWGGRATVGGSPWNNASQLNPQEVVSIVCCCNKFSSLFA